MRLANSSGINWGASRVNVTEDGRITVRDPCNYARQHAVELLLAIARFHFCFAL